MFARIEYIDDVLPYIEDCEHIKVKDQGTYSVILYSVMAPDVFPSLKPAGGSAASRRERLHKALIRRECRGIAFDNKTERIISRPFHKFFNLNQVPDTQSKKIDLTQPHRWELKLDGSMIRTITGIGYGTKAGESDVSQLASDYANKRDNYVNLFKYCEQHDLTAMFEFCSRKAKIVIDYPEDSLPLLAIRHNITGEYLGIS